MTKLLIIGCGSIGRRHMRVFRELGIEKIIGVDTREDRRAQAMEEVNIDAVYEDYKEALSTEKPDIVVISTPPHIHTPIAIDVAKAGAHLFIEKPIAMDLEGLEELEAAARENNIVAYTAYCYRFIPSVGRLRELVEENRVGKPLVARLWISSYLPDWHPYEDYRTFYMARKDQGGGALLDESHGIDLLRWLFGEVKQVSAYVGNVSDLEISSDDYAFMHMRMENGLPVQAHFDLLGRCPRIGMEIVGADGTILWDRINPKIEIYDADTKEWSTESFDPDDTVQSYGRQAQHFLDCIENGDAIRTSLADGRQTLEVLLSGFESSEKEMTVSVKSWQRAIGNEDIFS